MLKSLGAPQPSRAPRKCPRRKCCENSRRQTHWRMRPLAPWPASPRRPTSSAARRRPRCPRRLLFVKHCNALEQTMRSLRVWRVDPALLRRNYPLVLRVPRRSLRSPSVSTHMNKNWSTSTSLEWHVANLTLAGSKKPRSASSIRQVCEGRLLHHPDLHADSDWKPPRSRQHCGALSSTETRQSQAQQRPRESTRRSFGRNSIGPTRELPWSGFMWMILSLSTTTALANPSRRLRCAARDSPCKSSSS